jgi:large subunit ribosomal protein L1
MPSPKLGTVVKNPVAAIRDLVGKTDYRERQGVVRLAIGQLGFTEAQLAGNIKMFLSYLKRDLVALPNVTKSIYEVVLSSTNASGFSLNGQIEPKVAGGGDRVRR